MAWSGQTGAAVAGPRLSEGLGSTALATDGGSQRILDDGSD